MALAAAAPAQADLALARYQDRFQAGMAALRGGETSKAFRAFGDCERMAADLPPEHRASAAFAAGLFALETVLRAGQVRDAELLPRARALRERAVADGAWSRERSEALRLRALVLTWRLTPEGAFARECDVEDRAWLMRDDFFALAIGRLAPMHTIARVLRLSLAIGTAQEPAALQDLAASEDAVARAVAAGGALPDDEAEWRGYALSALCRYHLERRNLDRAQVYADRLPPDRSRDVRSLLALQREDHGQAAALAREMVAAGDERGHGLLADALEAGGQPAQALAHYDKALAIAATPSSRAAAHNGRGDCLLETGRLADAGLAYRQALAECDAAGIGLLAERAETRKDQGRLAEAAGDAGAAFAAYREALAIGERAREQLLRDPFGGAWLRVHGDQLTAIDGVLRTWAAAGGSAWEVVAACEAGRARSLLDAVTGAAPVVPVADLQQLAVARLLADTPEAIARVDAGLEVLRTRAATMPGRAAPPAPAALREWCVQRPETTFVAYWFGRTQVWVLTIAGAQVVCEPVGGVDTARAAVAEAFAAVATPQGDAAALARAAGLLLPPAVRARLVGRIAVVLDATMTRLPFEALVQTAVGPLPVVRVPSLAVAAALGARSGPTGSGAIVVVDAGDPALLGRLRLDPLAFSVREGDAVAQALGGATVLRGAEASFARLRAAVGACAPAVVHVSAHAVDCPGFPSQSLLLLGDGPVAMAALGELHLRGALVVLSACGAGAGEQRGQEGNVGLVEGAFAAGAGTVVAPFAEINQQATCDLMAQFYDRLAAGDDAAAAMAAARSVLARAPQYAHPHYWASFAVHGDGAPGSGRLPERAPDAVRVALDRAWPWLLLAVAAAAIVRRRWRRCPRCRE